jgi:hypothetical protein
MAEHRKGIPLKVWLDEETYALLKAWCRRRGIELLPECVQALVRETLESPASSPQPGLDSLIKRVERTIQDLLNPFTGKIDEINRRLSEVIELLESEEARESPPLPSLRTPLPQERVEARASRRPSAIDRLKEEGVVFEDDVKWMRSPSRFFHKLEREGAIVIDVQGEKVAVDPEFWRGFLDEVKSLQVSDLGEAASIIEDRLGPQAAKLFRRLVRAGLLHFNEESGSWEPSESLEASGSE